MRIGLILHADTGDGHDQARQIDTLLDTICASERAGLATVWLTEQHYQAHSPTPRPELLIAYAAAKTRRIEFGTAALTFGQRSALEIAEIASSLAVLAPRRLRLGVARGKFSAAPQATNHSDRAPFIDSLAEPIDALAAWLEGHALPTGAEGALKRLAPTPPPRADLPVYLATRQISRMARAAAHGFGLMVGQFWPTAPLNELLAEYRRHNPIAPELMVSRGFCPGKNTATARAKAFTHIEAVRQRKPNPQGTAPGQRPIDRVTADSVADFVLLGDESAQREALQQLAALGVTDLALNLMTDDPIEQAEWLAALGELSQHWQTESA